MTTLHPIKLAVIPGGWRNFVARKSDPSFAKFRDKVFERDDYTCNYCGFQAKKYQEVVNLDGNYSNNKMSNLVTSCCFCAQCFFLETVGKDDYGGGVLVYLPKIGQTDLNGFCHVLFCAMSNATSYAIDARNIYRGLKSRRDVIEKQIGEGMSDPSLFGRMLLDSPGQDRKKVMDEVLPSLRLLPSYSKFVNQVRGWSDSVDEDLS